MRRILIVDDDRPILEAVEELLRGEGFHVTGTDRPERAEGLAKSFDPDVVLVDLMMPGMDGIEVAQRVRGVTNVPIVLMTAHPAAAGMARAAGASRFLRKPFSGRALVEAVLADAGIGTTALEAPAS